MGRKRTALFTVAGISGAAGVVVGYRFQSRRMKYDALYHKITRRLTEACGGYRMAVTASLLESTSPQDGRTLISTLGPYSAGEGDLFCAIVAKPTAGYERLEMRIEADDRTVRELETRFREYGRDQFQLDQALHGELTSCLVVTIPVYSREDTTARTLREKLTPEES